MEFLDILNEDGNITGITKERSAVHADGDLHGTAHIWVVRVYDGRFQVLLQMRSEDKDSHPSCFDTSSAGHISAGDGFLESAVREVAEELGLYINESDLEFICRIRTYSEGEFYGKDFTDNQITNVYLLKINVDINDITVQKSEIQYVEWQDGEFILERLIERNKEYCINIDEYKRVWNYINDKGIDCIGRFKKYI